MRRETSETQTSDDAQSCERKVTAPLAASHAQAVTLVPARWCARGPQLNWGLGPTHSSQQFRSWLPQAASRHSVLQQGMDKDAVPPGQRKITQHRKTVSSQAGRGPEEP